MNSRQKHFEDLVIYQRSFELTKQVYRLTNSQLFSSDFSLKDQVRRASVSVMSNIAEGFERGSNAELIQFLYISKGSCGEVRAQLSLASDLGYIDVQAGREILDRCRGLSAMIANMIASLKESNYRGPKYRFVRPDRAQEAKEFLEEILREQAEKAQEAQEAQEAQGAQKVQKAEGASRL